MLGRIREPGGPAARFFDLSTEHRDHRVQVSQDIQRRAGSRPRFVAIERAGAPSVRVDRHTGALFRAEWEYRRDYGDNRPIEVIDLDGVQRAVRPRDVTEVKNCY